MIPLTLAENAGLNPITTVTELRNRHSQGEVTAGINVRKVIYKNKIYINVQINYSVVFSRVQSLISLKKMLYNHY